MTGVNRKSKLSVSAPVRAALRGGSSTLPPLCLPPSHSSIQSHVPTWACISSPLGCLPLHASRPEAPGTSLQTHMITGIAAPGNWDREESMSWVRGWGKKKKSWKGRIGALEVPGSMAGLKTVTEKFLFFVVMCLIDETSGFQRLSRNHRN